LSGNDLQNFLRYLARVGRCGRIEPVEKQGDEMFSGFAANKPQIGESHCLSVVRYSNISRLKVDNGVVPFVDYQVNRDFIYISNQSGACEILAGSAVALAMR